MFEHNRRGLPPADYQKHRDQDNRGHSTDSCEKPTTICNRGLGQVLAGHLDPLGPGPSHKSLRHSGGNLTVKMLRGQLGEALSADLREVVGRTTAVGTVFEVRPEIGQLVWGGLPAGGQSAQLLVLFMGIQRGSSSLSTPVRWPSSLFPWLCSSPAGHPAILPSRDIDCDGPKRPSRPFLLRLLPPSNPRNR